MIYQRRLSIDADVQQGTSNTHDQFMDLIQGNLVLLSPIGWIDMLTGLLIGNLHTRILMIRQVHQDFMIGTHVEGDSHRVIYLAAKNRQLEASLEILRDILA